MSSRLSVAVPLLSTEASPGGFEVTEVAKIATSAALDFLSRKNMKYRVVPVGEAASPALEALHREHATAAGGERRLIIKACTLPNVAQAGAPCAYIINPCNWLLVGRGGRTNVLVNKAAGPCLEMASLEGRKRALIADPIPVRLPRESRLRAEGQVETVIQVLGPNIARRFSDCLKSKPDEACRLLRLAYDNALECFGNLAAKATDIGDVPERFPEKVRGDVLRPAQVMDGTESSEAAASSVCKPSEDGSQINATNLETLETTSCALLFPRYRDGPPARCPASGVRRGHWKTALFRYLQQPRPPSLQDGIFYEDHWCVIVYDAYPKAKYHLLLLPKPHTLGDITQPGQLSRIHLPALRCLHALAIAAAEALSTSSSELFRCGYHAIPSLEPIHIHIISQDFESPFLRKRKHWNSFTTDFFLECSWVEARVADRGKLHLDFARYKDLEYQGLQCFRCGVEMSTMPAIKAHNKSCRSSYRLDSIDSSSLSLSPDRTNRLQCRS